MKRYVVGFALTGALGLGVALASAQDQDGNLRLAPQTRVYVIQRGDTLWDISADKLNSPWYWPRIWRINPEVVNPHLIYPGQELRLPGAGDEAVAVGTQPPPSGEQPAAEPVPEPAIEEVPAGTVVQPTRETPAATEESDDDIIAVQEQLPDFEPESRLTTAIIPTPRTERFVVRVGSEGFIASEKVRAAGAIVGSHSEKLLYGQNDIVFISLGAGSGVEPGQRFTVFNTLEQVEHPVTGAPVGHRTVQLGILEVTSVQDDVATAVILESYDAIDKGALLQPFEPYEKRITPQPGPDDLSGYVLTPAENLTIAGEHQLVYIDQGSGSVSVGQSFRIFRPMGDEQDPLTGKMLRLPPKLIGAAIVVDVQPQTATALVWDSKDFIVAGDSIGSLQGR